MDRGFEFLDHTADVLIKVWGESIESIFEEAAKAVFEVMTDTSRVDPKMGVSISVCGFDLENLLYRWLEEMLYHHDSKSIVFSKFAVEKVYETGTEERQVCIEGRAYGEEFQSVKHEPRTVVKAITYSEMKIWREKDKWYATFVIDI